MRTPLRGMGPPGNPSNNEVLTMGDNHRYATWDAAYVLGSLSAADRREFEAHMATCADCREAVGELSGVPALLSLLDREDVVAIDESGAAPEPGSAPTTLPKMSPDMLPSLLGAVRFRRRRTRVATWVASAAAAAVLGVGVFVGVESQSSPAAQQVTASARADVTGRDEPADLDGVGVQPALGDVHQPEMRLPGSADCAP